MSCQGPAGTAGTDGTDGTNGTNGTNGSNGTNGTDGTDGTNGTDGCDGLSAGQTPGLKTELSLSSTPAAGYFDTGEQVVITIRFKNNCGRTFKASDLGTANLYVNGPRKSSTRSANKLLNCVTDRAATDRQHHFINLAAPRFTDPNQANLIEAADGSITYTLAPISDEAPGTYTVGVWATSKDSLDQLYQWTEFQLKTATAEIYASGHPDTATCTKCHRNNAAGKNYMHHIEPGRNPVGSYGLDARPIASCKGCHNLDGYSANPFLRKIHGVHRGSHLLTPGAAHPEYGLPSLDSSLANYTNVLFPAMPDHEKDCAVCHVDDRWKTSPSRLACGTCHENVFFDSGTLNPPRIFGTPAAGACTVANDCSSFGSLAVCNTGTGACERRAHPVQNDDTNCATCHTADSSGFSPIPARHEVLAQTRIRGLQMLDARLEGATGPNGTFLVGDTPVLKFKLVDSAGAAIANLVTNPALTGTVTGSGPTNDRQRIYNILNMKTQGTLAYDSGTTEYTYTLPSPIPATTLAPFNNPTAPTRPTGSGTYTLLAYVNENLTVAGKSVRDAATVTLNFKLGADQPIRPRQVVLNAACDACHVQLQMHGGSRRGGEICSNCHTQGAMDRTVGARGRACTVDAQCAGFAAGWEACQDTNSDATPDTCVVVADPTPAGTIFFSQMIHNIHFARLREGYSERNNLVNPGSLSLLGFQNSLLDFSDPLFPQDIRNCAKCHADSGATCSATNVCGVGQTCSSGQCVNVAWKQPSARVCLSCHDSSAATAHAALQTWLDGDGNPVESCQVCHGPKGEFSVELVHNIVSPYKPPYLRTKQ